MKRLIYFFALILSFMAVSCNHDIDSYDYSQHVTDIYNTAFVKTFGQPASNQTWGFEGKTLPFGNVTRSAQPNSNQWGTTDDNSKYIDYPRPADITDAERAKVLNVFNQKGKTSYEPLVIWENFFVQQVYCGPNGSKMNELAATVDYTVTTTVISWWPYEATITRTSVIEFDDIINNFNAGAYSGNQEQGCMLMFNSSTANLSYKTSQSGGQRWYNHWRMEQIDGSYYVGFDHEAVRQASANDNEEDVRDYVYNDWIVKLVPGNGNTPDRYTVRIICEDLNANNGSDFDFNDVVFDASYIDGVNKTYITLQAAGGTLPLFVAGHEVHGEFNVPVTTMVNTNNGTVNKETVTFEIDDIIAPWDIEVAVIKNNQLIPLKAETGSPTAKIAVDPDFIWCNEREDIRTRYPDFSKYVQDTSVNWY